MYWVIKSKIITNLSIKYKYYVLDQIVKWTSFRYAKINPAYKTNNLQTTSAIYSQCDFLEKY
jgi:hypothetical protein